MRTFIPPSPSRPTSLSDNAVDIRSLMARAIFPVTCSRGEEHGRRGALQGGEPNEPRFLVRALRMMGRAVARSGIPAVCFQGLRLVICMSMCRGGDSASLGDTGRGRGQRRRREEAEREGGRAGGAEGRGREGVVTAPD